MSTRPRLIPVLLLKSGVIVRSQLFKVHQVIGNPMSTVERYSQWNVDELILLDISRGEDHHDLRRDDLQQSYAGSSAVDVLREVAKVCFMPLTFGGRIHNLADIEARLAAGADKVSINTAALQDPQLIAAAARRFGSQCIVLSVDVRRHGDGRYEVFGDGGRTPTGRDPLAWAREAEQRGAGEILLTSIDRDGAGNGYDLELVRRVATGVSIPTVALGGVGRFEDFAPAINEAGASGVAAANIFHFFEVSYPLAKRAAIAAGAPMRPAELGSRWFRREPEYDVAKETARIEERLRQAREQDFPAARPSSGSRRRSVRWCTHCVYPSISAAPMEFDTAGKCTGCQMAEVKARISREEWQRRWGLLEQLADRYRSKDGSRHDCVIAVSGGKDSYFQTHVIKERLGLNPLLVTYDGNNWTPPGWRNMVRMREAFGVDHIVVRPSVQTLKKLNRLAFVTMGDMNWHAHVGIMTVPMAMAAREHIPLVFYGEHGYLDLCGQFSMDDFPEVSYRDRLEHFARGYEWTYFVGREGLRASDLAIYRYPSDQEIVDLDLRGIFLGNYLPWEANEHIKLVQERYGFEVSDVPFERTYRRMSNLDDMHENGMHDYLKYVKFGYGRCTDHASKDIRAGLLGRDEAIALVDRYDSVKSSDLQRWLEYVEMSEAEFDAIADTFRDPRVWHMQDGRWTRDRLEPRAAA